MVPPRVARCALGAPAGGAPASLRAALLSAAFLSAALLSAAPLAPLTQRDAQALERAAERLSRGLRAARYKVPAPRALEALEGDLALIERLAARLHQASRPAAERAAAVRAWRALEGLLHEEAGPLARFEGRLCVRPHVRANLGGAWAHHGRPARALEHFRLAAACTHEARTHWQAAVEAASRCPDPALRAAAAARLEALSPAAPQE
ncbi:MAG: hypothetical protein FJ138_11575 [Deltaproteobacteria bacterium]|nr:hypothetical protein [Deltaproteobacteria bacterium]